VLNESFVVIAKPVPIPITIDYGEHEVVVSSDETSVRINKVSNVIEISFGDLVIKEISRSAVKQCWLRDRVLQKVLSGSQR